MKKAGEPAEERIAEMREVSDRIKKQDEDIRELENRLNELLLSFPNIPHESVPTGKDEADNVEIRRWGDLPTFEFEPRAHWDIAEQLGLLDFEGAAKVTGSRFVFYTGLGAGWNGR